MNPKKASPKKASAEARRDEEWVPSRTGEAELNRLVEAGVLLDRVTARWRPALVEPFPMPHPFLRDLLEFWVISLCNLHPNTILHISVFIHFCETYMGVLPHFNLFRHLFWVKKKGGGGSKVVGGVYLQLRDGMASEYISVPLNTSLKGWNSKWFYMKQSHPAIRCDIHHIPKN